MDLTNLDTNEVYLSVDRHGSVLLRCPQCQVEHLGPPARNTAEMEAAIRGLGLIQQLQAEVDRLRARAVEGLTITPEEAAWDLLPGPAVLVPQDAADLRAQIAGAIRAAVLEEREACVQIGLSLTRYESGCCRELAEQIADAIRARGG